jgi:hypothetical protein
MANPVRAAAAATAPRGAPSPRASASAVMTGIRQAMATPGRFGGLIRPATSCPPTAPAARLALITPQAAAPPRYRWARAGPSTVTGASGHAAGQGEGQRRRGLAGQHQPQPARRTGHPQHREAQRHRPEAVGRPRRDQRGQDESQPPVGQQARVLTPSSPALQKYARTPRVGQLGLSSGGRSCPPAPPVHDARRTSGRRRNGVTDCASVQRSVHDLTSLQYQRMSSHAPPPSGTSRPSGCVTPHIKHSATSSGRRRWSLCSAGAAGSDGASRRPTGNGSGCLTWGVAIADEACRAMTPPRGTGHEAP